MLSIKEAALFLEREGINATEQVLTSWISEGIIKASGGTGAGKGFVISPEDLMAFIAKKKASGGAQNDYAVLEQLKLRGEIEELRTALRIEQTKVRSLKKMLKAEYALTNSMRFNSSLLLGLENGADQEVIKREFKKLLKALHPDRGGDERLFKVFSEHYRKIKELSD